MCEKLVTVPIPLWLLGYAVFNDFENISIV